MASSGLEDEYDPTKEARAYNNSILFMLAMPYLLTTAVGLLVWREVRKARRKQFLDAAAST